MKDTTYIATIEHVKDEREIACECRQCDWTGTADQLDGIEDAVLTPGDPSPAGRCPECHALAYVVPVSPQTEQDWAMLGGAEAYQIIQQHATNWIEAAAMMEAWGKARFGGKQ